MSAYKEQLKRLIAERAVQFGEFVLSSGQKSDYYVDLRLITLDPQGAYLTAKVLLEAVGADVDAIGGPDHGRGSDCWRCGGCGGIGGTFGPGLYGPKGAEGARDAEARGRPVGAGNARGHRG